MKTLLILCLTSVLLIPPVSAEPKHIVMLLWRGVTDADQGFMDYLAQKQDVKFTLLNADKDIRQLTDHIQSLEEHKPDLVYTFGTTITLALLGNTLEPTPFRQVGKVPVVFSIVTDPVGSALVNPDGKTPDNFTGVSHIVPHDTQFKVMQKLGNMQNLAVLYNPLESNSRITAQKLVEISANFNTHVRLFPFPLKGDKPDISALPDMIASLKEANIDMVYFPPDSFIISQADTITQHVHDADIPTFSATETPIRKSGALFGVVSNYYNVGQFAAYKAEQILTGRAHSSDIPIEALSQYSYIVNINAAKQLNYYPPVSILKISEFVGEQK